MMQYLPRPVRYGPFLAAVCCLVAALPTLATTEAGAGPQRQAMALGVVVDQDGRPLPGVSVHIETFREGPGMSLNATVANQQVRQSGRTGSQNDVKTAEDGSFRYPSLYATVEYRVRFEKEGFVPQETRMVFHVAGNDMGTIVLVSGDVERAREAFEKGDEAYRSGQLQAAMPFMEEVAEAYGESNSSDEMLVVALGVLGQGYLQQNRADDAGRVLGRLLDIQPDSAIALRGLGQVDAMQGRMGEAVERFELAVQVEPDNVNGRFLLGYALQFSGRGAEAIPHLEACLELNPRYGRAHKSLGMALADTGENARAIEHLEAYLEAMPGAPDTAEVQSKLAELRE